MLPILKKLTATSFLHKLAAYSNALQFPPEQTYVTKFPVMQILHISEETLWRRCNPKCGSSYDPAFPKRKFGGNVRRWKLSEVLAYAEGNSTTTA